MIKGEHFRGFARVSFGVHERHLTTCAVSFNDNSALVLDLLRAHGANPNDNTHTFAAAANKKGQVKPCRVPHTTIQPQRPYLRLSASLAAACKDTTNDTRTGYSQQRDQAGRVANKTTSRRTLAAFLAAAEGMVSTARCQGQYGGCAAPS